MINKKKFLGKNPDEIGVKDAVHVAIVSVIAASAIKGGSRIQLNSDGHAINANEGSGFGVADPFIGIVARGEKFWVLVDPDSVAEVSHSWDHVQSFPKDVKPVEKNKYLQRYATAAGVTYEQLIEACSQYMETGRKSPYPGTMTVDEGEEAFEKIETGDMWYEWANESLYEFENIGSECCPEYDYPGLVPFEWV